MSQKASQFKTRTADVSDAGRSSFRFNEATWEAIDAIAAKQGKKWVDWVREVIAAKPEVLSKAEAIRAAVTSAQFDEQYEAARANAAAGEIELIEPHPLLNKGYYRLDDESLDIELSAATITHRDNSFESFELIAGFRSKDLSPTPQAFLCMRNRLRDGLHVFIVQDDES